MNPLELLPLAIAEVQSRLDQIGDRWDAPTPCEGWAIRDLVAHLVAGSTMSTVLLNGGSADDAKALFSKPLGSAPVAEFAEAAAAELSGFQRADLTTPLNHPMMVMPAGQVLGFRIGDYTMHAWDLSHALGLSDALNPVLVQAVWDMLAPMAPMIGQIGVFGAGPSGNVPDTAPLQDRLVDLTGRRPS